MATKTLYDKIIDRIEMLFEVTPPRERLLWALSQTVPEEDMRIYLMLPMGKHVPLEKIKAKAAKLGYTPEKLQETLDRLYKEAFVFRHQGQEGTTYESCMLLLTIEQQVRLKKGTPVGDAYGDYWVAMGNTGTPSMTNKTAIWRIIPLESTIKEDAATEIKINHQVPDKSEIIPLEVLSEIICSQSLIAVSECYCRLSHHDQHCTAPLETCFSFGIIGQSLIDIGVARQVTAEETIKIMRECEKVGLVHMVDNCKEGILGSCNCCPCCCPSMKIAATGKKECLWFIQVSGHPER